MEQLGFWNTSVYVGKTASEKMNKYRLVSEPDWTPPKEYKSFRDLPRIGLDIESYDPSLKKKGSGALTDEAFIVGVSIAYEDGSIYYPLRHERGRNVANPAGFIAWLKEEAKTYSGSLVGANLLYDLFFLASEGVHFPLAKIDDVQYAAALIDECADSYSLSTLAKTYLNDRKYSNELEEIYGKDYIKNMPRLHAGHVQLYANQDTQLPLRIIDKQYEIMKDQQLMDVYKVEQGIVPLMLRMKEQGVRIDLEKAERAYTVLQERAASCAAQIKDVVGLEVNVWAADSIAKAFDKQGIPYPRTKTGKPSFVKSWLESHQAKEARLIVEQRKYERMANTFVKGYILEGNMGGRIHCTFNQLRSDEDGTVSGRFSSSNPNLQNIPARDPELGPLLRSMFIPEEGYLWGAIDWSQIEFRFLIHMCAALRISGVEQALNMYRADPTTDFHNIAASITGTPRSVAKNINFGVVYGMGAAKMAASLGTSQGKATQMLEEFHTRLPFLKAVSQHYVRMAEEKGYIATILGRRRRFNEWEVTYQKEGTRTTDTYYTLKKKHISAIPDYLPSLKKLKEYIEEFDGVPTFDDVVKDVPLKVRIQRSQTYAALNAQLQGSAADLMKVCMLKMWDDGVFNTLVPHLTVHDELDMSIPNTKEGKEAFAHAQWLMENTMKLNVPLIAVAKLGNNWSECK